MSKLIFEIQRAVKGGKSPIKILLESNGKKYSTTIENTDFILSALDRLLKSAKLKIESLKNIRVDADKEAGLTSTRIVKSIIEAFRFS